jgi:hypothetical protein
VVFKKTFLKPSSQLSTVIIIGKKQRLTEKSTLASNAKKNQKPVR